MQEFSWLSISTGDTKIAWGFGVVFRPERKEIVHKRKIAWGILNNQAEFLSILNALLSAIQQG